MNILDRAYDLIARADRVETTDQLQSVLRYVLVEAEASALVLRERLPDANDTIRSHVSAALGAERWFEADLATDFMHHSPVKSFLLKRKRAITVGVFDALVRESGAERLCAEFKEAAGMGEYTVVPIVGAGQTVGSLSVATSRGALAPDATTLLALVAPSLRVATFRLRRMAMSQHRVPLSPREIEVLKWSSLGRTSSDIADTLKISERTANAHVNSALTKLGVASRTQAVAEAIRIGYFD